MIYNNLYVCPCGNKWTEEYNCECNDRCPACNKEISPTPWVGQREALNRLHSGFWMGMSSEGPGDIVWFMRNGQRVYRHPDNNDVQISGHMGSTMFYEVKT